MASDKVNFPEVGAIAQAMKHQIRSGNYWEDLPPASKESLDQIATSIARMVAGDGVQQWDAIIGFAHAAKPEPPTVDLNIPHSAAERAAKSQPPPTSEIERNIRSLVAREIPARNPNET